MPGEGLLQDPEVLKWARVMRADEVVSKAAPVEEILGAVRRVAERGSRGKTMRVLIAIEPRLYRETIGRVLRGLRPHLEVVVVEPEDLCAAVVRSEPQLVFADRPDNLPDAGRLAWVEFRPYEQPPAKIRLGERWHELEEVELSDLLSVVDETEELTRTRESGNC